jgi:hypothetical protein
MFTNLEMPRPTTSEQKKIFSRLAQDYTPLLPIIGAFFILYGVIDLLTFYKEFDISIMSYVSFSEIIIYFIKDIYYVSIHVCVMVICAYFLSRAKRKRAAETSAGLVNKKKKVYYSRGAWFSGYPTHHFDVARRLDKRSTNRSSAAADVRGQLLLQRDDNLHFDLRCPNVIVFSIHEIGLFCKSIQKRQRESVY